MTDPIKIISKIEFDKNNRIFKQEIVWDSIAAPWKTYVVKKIPIVEEFLKDKSGKVIDLGCGTGRNMIKNDSIEYLGVDFSQGQLKHTKDYIKKNQIKAKLIKSKVDDLSFLGDCLFDYGLFIATLHCLETEKQRKQALLEFYRVLKKGAEGLISVWNSEDKRFDKVRKEKDIYMSWREDGVPYMRYYYLYEREEFLKLLGDAGFKILEIYKKREHDRFSKKNLVVRVKK